MCVCARVSLCLQNQHEELKKQFYVLQEQHHAQGQDHSKVLDEHQQRYEQLQQAKEIEVSKLKGITFIMLLSLHRSPSLYRAAFVLSIPCDLVLIKPGIPKLLGQMILNGDYTFSVTPKPHGQGYLSIFIAQVGF